MNNFLGTSMLSYSWLSKCCLSLMICSALMPFFCCSANAQQSVDGAPAVEEGRTSLSLSVTGECDQLQPVIVVVVENKGAQPFQFPIRSEPWRVNMGGLRVFAWQRGANEKLSRRPPFVDNPYEGETLAPKERRVNRFYLSELFEIAMNSEEGMEIAVRWQYDFPLGDFLVSGTSGEFEIRCLKGAK